MDVLAHIGNIPVEEWLPFVVPVVALYLYGRRSSRRREAALKRVGDGISSLDEPTVERILEHWSTAGHEHLTREHVRLLYPPGVDGASIAEIAHRLDRDPRATVTSLEVLAELGYVDLDPGAADGERRAWLTADGFNLVHGMEDLLLDRAKAARGER
jgi:hypothetical protein